MFQGIRDYGSGTINQVAFENIEYNPGTDYAGTGLVAFGTASVVNVTNSTFADIGREGVLFYGTGTTGNFSGNTYTGKGAGNWLDYAVEVGAGASATITANTITGNTGVATVDGSTSAGVIVTTYYGPGSVSQATITHNFINGNTEAVGVGYGAGDTSNVAISGNDLSGNVTDAVSNSSASATVNASGNWWGSVNGPTAASNTYAYDGMTTGGSVAGIGAIAVIPWYTSNATTGQTPGFYPVGPLDTATPGVALSTVTLADGVTPADGSTTAGWTTNTATPTFSGTAAAGSTVAVLEGTTVLGQTTAAGDGTWSITLASASALSEGTHDIVARATSQSGEQGFISNPTSVTVGVVTTPAFIGLSSPTITYGTATTTFAGTITAGPFFPTGSVTVSIVGTAITGDATINPDGTFTCDLATSSLHVVHGAYTISYAYSDTSGVYNSITDTSTALTVRPKTLTATIAAQTKPYDGGTTGVSTVATLAGLVSPDSFTVARRRRSTTARTWTRRRR